MRVFFAVAAILGAGAAAPEPRAHRLLVQFEAYRPLAELEEAVGGALGVGNATAAWEHVQRPNAFAREHPTDFCVVSFPTASGADALRPALEALPGVRRVVRDRSFRSRELLQTAADDGGRREGERWSCVPGGECDPADMHPTPLVRGPRALSGMDDDGGGGGGDDDGSTTGARSGAARRLMGAGGAGRSVLEAGGGGVAAETGAPALWERGFTGAGVRVAIFDTGLRANHPHFRNVADRTEWTDEGTLSDGHGHGTFVAGVIASQSQCLGLAPDAELYVFRVFTNQQLSFTSWFLDAFNYAIWVGVDVLNLSIGGPDFLDAPFVDKVREASANGIAVVSAIGNDGPNYGTLNNPADQADVIGVGGLDRSGKIASFSSRGMTTWELPRGSGRVKPDVVTQSKDIRGSRIQSGCRGLSGTSVASPVVAGALALLASAAPPGRANPGSLKQALLESALPVPGANVFEQGAGRLSLDGALDALLGSAPHASALPAALDLTHCPHMWPYCAQPLYHTALPQTVNVTLLSSLAAHCVVEGAPRWEPDEGLGDEVRGALAPEFEWSAELWPWSGWLAVRLVVPRPVREAVTVTGTVRLTVAAPGPRGGRSRVRSEVAVRVRALVVPTPPRERRVLWDQFHSLRYPSGYFPRDDLDSKADVLDWNGDHVHTNFRELFTHLRSLGYSVEVLGTDWTCFNASDYGTLVLADPEEEYFAEEREKLVRDVRERGLSVLVLADWYNREMMEKVKFFDDNTDRWWTPLTGGANVPALNGVLAPFGVALGTSVYKGTVRWGGNSLYYASGTSLVRFPRGGLLARAPLRTVIAGPGAARRQADPAGVPVLGLLAEGEGRVAVFGDSNCLDTNHRKAPACAWLLTALMEFVADGRTDRRLFPEEGRVTDEGGYEDPAHAEARRPDGDPGGHMGGHSRVTRRGAWPECSAFPRPEPGPPVVRPVDDVLAGLGLPSNEARGGGDPERTAVEGGPGAGGGRGGGGGWSPVHDAAFGGGEGGAGGVGTRQGPAATPLSAVDGRVLFRLFAAAVMLLALGYGLVRGAGGGSAPGPRRPPGSDV